MLPDARAGPGPGPGPGAVAGSLATSLGTLTANAFDPAFLCAVVLVVAAAMGRMASRGSHQVRRWAARTFTPLLGFPAHLFRRRGGKIGQAASPGADTSPPADVDDSKLIKTEPVETSNLPTPSDEIAPDAQPAALQAEETPNTPSDDKPAIDADPGAADPSPPAALVPSADDPPAEGTEGTEPLPTEPAISLPPPVTDPVMNDRLPVLNPMRFTTGAQSFTLFLRLPPELRIKIWQAALQRHRFVRIYSAWGSFKNPSRASDSGNWPGAYQREVPTPNGGTALVSGQLYSAHRGVRDGWESRRFPSALLAVNSEARAVALEFYRVRLPAFDNPEEGSGWRPVLYLNPEWDYLRLFSKHATGLLDFLNDVKAHDPNGVGVANLVVGMGTLKELNKVDFATLRAWETPVANKIPSLLRGLRSVYFSHRDRDKSRFRLPCPRPFDVEHPRSPLQPIFARPTEFHVLGTDPRPGVRDALAELWTGESLRAVFDDWKRLLDFYGMPLSSETEHCHMISVRPDWRRFRTGTHSEWVHDREDMEDLLMVDADMEQKKALKEEPKDAQHTAGATHGDVQPQAAGEDAPSDYRPQAASSDRPSDGQPQAASEGGLNGGQTQARGEDAPSDDQPQAANSDRPSDGQPQAANEGGLNDGQPKATGEDAPSDDQPQAASEDRPSDGQPQATGEDRPSDGQSHAASEEGPAAERGAATQTETPAEMEALDSLEKGKGKEKEEARTERPERVAGFWLLPADAFQDYDQYKAGMYRWDVSSYSPRLGVFRLPDKASVRW